MNSNVRIKLINTLYCRQGCYLLTVFVIMGSFPPSVPLYNCNSSRVWPNSFINTGLCWIFFPALWRSSTFFGILDSFNQLLLPSDHKTCNQTIKITFAKHLSNNGKYEIIKKILWHGIILNTVKKKLSKLKLSRLPRKKIELKINHISIKTKVSY